MAAARNRAEDTVALDTVDVDEIEELKADLPKGPAAWNLPPPESPLNGLRAKLHALESEISQAERGFMVQLEDLNKALEAARERGEAAERRLLALKELLEDA